ncbi:hypothetical protein [Mogibacterium timidum]|uniref:hypothetical protein n=1 Tax=Mogibacterium timidum TaxID=35519 RepID=UPI00248AD7C0|nr:hypothetical protein [Mogibacterium timidum]
MANLNSENPHDGRKFQEFVQVILKEKYDIYFEQEAVIPIGRPSKAHKFDLANADRSIVVECKCYTWTDSGNVPSVKVMGLEEAVFYFGFLPSGTKKLLCMKKQCSVASRKRWQSIMFENMGSCLKMFL